MKFINSHIQAQVIYGASSQSANYIQPYSGGGWTIFAMPGSLPADETAVNTRFNTKSLADLYNKSLGIVKSPVLSISKSVNLNLAPISNYTPKGVSYFGTIGGISYTQLQPHSIVETDVTKRDITPMVSTAVISPLGVSPLVRNTFDFVFDSEVKLTHVKRFLSTSTVPTTLFAVSDTGVESSSGTLTVLAADSSVWKLANPLTSKRFRLKFDASTMFSTFLLLSDTTQATSDTLEQPGWVVFAPGNTIGVGDTAFSDNIPWIAEKCEAAGPFVILPPIKANVQNTMYCPKIRFDNWRSV
ncbi:hypothetical protein fHeYen902_312c [Yersinia phage fHe-Yen9-02]|nr:hypothetical protein fHeYen902_312c [Yersinia phage fHe-Yen9-02]